MSFAALTWAKQQTCGSPAAKLILMLLAEHAGPTHLCWPSQSLLAAESEQTRQTVSVHLGHLEKLGLIRREQRMRASGGKSSCLYRLLLQGTLDFGQPTPADLAEGDETFDQMCDAIQAEIDGVGIPDIDGVGIHGVKNPDIVENGGKPPNPQNDGVKNPDIAMSARADSHIEPSILNQKERGAGAGARDAFVPDDSPLWKPLEAKWLREHPDKRSMPRSSDHTHGRQGWRFPTIWINDVRDRGGKVLA